MKKLIFILTVICFCNYTFAQTEECQIGTDSAKADFAKGILRTYIFGLTNTFTFGRLLKEEYGIEAIYGGCIVESQSGCYSNFMAEKIKLKFGADVFEKVAKKAQQLDITGKGDRQASFPGGEMELMKFVYCNLDLTKANYSESKKGRVFIQFTIDTKGRPVDIKVLKTANEDYSTEAIRLINLMHDWITATQNGKTIRQQWNLPILFDHEWKEKHCP